MVSTLGNLVLSLWDCGGQDIFMENYFESQREHIFRHAEVEYSPLSSSTIAFISMSCNQLKSDKIDVAFFINSLTSRY